MNQCMTPKSFLTLLVWSTKITQKVVLVEHDAKSPTPQVGYHLDDEKRAVNAEHHEVIVDADGNLMYDHPDVEPQFHWRTWCAVVALTFLNFTQSVALQGPPTVLTYIGKDLHGSAAQGWVPNSLALVQATLGPVISSASDVFQARKVILVVSCVLSFIGAAMAPGSQMIGRLIVAQTLIDVGLSAVPLAYVIPSEILPRKWRPLAQSIVNLAASLAAICGPLIIGALTKRIPVNVTIIGILLGYRPPNRHTRLDDHMSVWQKIGQLDLVGFCLLTIGLSLFLTGIGLGGSLFKWHDVQPLATLVIGIATMVGFGIWEWKGTKTGIMHHDLFTGGRLHGRTFATLIFLMLCEGVMIFAVVIYYPVINIELFTQDPLMIAVRGNPTNVACLLTTFIYGWVASKRRSIRLPLFVGFAIFTAGPAGLASVTSSASTRMLIFVGLAGVGFAAPLVLIISGVQLSSPHHLLGTATTSARAVGATAFTAIYGATLNTQLTKTVTRSVPAAVISAGLPRVEVGPFIEALSSGDSTALTKLNGVTPAIIAAGIEATKTAFADAVRWIYVIAACFGVLACIAVLFLGDLRSLMGYRVQAPIEELHGKHEQPGST